MGSRWTHVVGHSKKRVIFKKNVSHLLIMNKKCILNLGRFSLS